ncbi:hypothetical protein B0J14DRAFT_43188 [Halenospora varia]|nr:hypothetical protein B0J14DRAFT_43188 [Halenospora varia]
MRPSDVFMRTGPTTSRSTCLLVAIHPRGDNQQGRPSQALLSCLDQDQRAYRQVTVSSKHILILIILLSLSLSVMATDGMGVLELRYLSSTTSRQTPIFFSTRAISRSFPAHRTYLTATKRAFWHKTGYIKKRHLEHDLTCELKIQQLRG